MYVHRLAAAARLNWPQRNQNVSGYSTISSHNVYDLHIPVSMKETLSPEVKAHGLLNGGQMITVCTMIYIQHAQTDSPAPTVAEVDPVLEKKYRDNFYAIVRHMQEYVML